VVPEAKSGAFVLMGGKGVAERKFDTLAEAVQFATDGDTIEGRGYGPFIGDRIKTRHALTIRAGSGFRPVIMDSPGASLQEVPFVTAAQLRLEGLELRCERVRVMIHAFELLAAANCGFLCLRQFATCLSTSNARI